MQPIKVQLTTFSLLLYQEARPIKSINSRSYGLSNLPFYHDSPFKEHGGLVDVWPNRTETVSSFIWAFKSRPQWAARLWKSPSLKWLLNKTAALCHPQCEAWLKQCITRTRELPNCKDKLHCFETTERKKDSETRNREQKTERVRRYSQCIKSSSAVFCRPEFIWPHNLAGLVNGAQPLNLPYLSQKAA